ncbi:MAG TPA: cytochrome c biogenesis protein CcsA, partial [Pirellulales bacterium]|nr:cytochrome c biogenesis protein CcsA [Pirellulales bacterium]
MTVDPTLIAIFLAYTVAWLLEASRLFARSATRGLAATGLTAGGFVVETCYLGYRAAAAPVSPLSSSFDWCLLAAWLLVAAFLYLAIYHPRGALALVVLPMALLLVLAAALFADQQPIAPQGASQLWGAIHGIFLLLGTVTVMIGFAAGVLYLIQATRLKRKLPQPGGLRLPSLEWLDRINSRVVVISTIFVAIGFLAGVVLNVSLARHGNRELSWSDPVIFSSALMLAWLVAAALFGRLYKPARHGR